MKTAKQEYKALIKQYKTIFKKQAKTVAPWDWGFMLTSIRTHIEFMAAYYRLGYNVHQTEESWKPILEQLDHCIDIYSKLDSLFDDLPQGSPIELDGKQLIFEPTSKERANAFDEALKQEQELYKELFNTIRDNFQDWWD